ncbi:GAF domain-containing protein [Paraoerskovia marina]|uniref:GAF domain-containing protein n=1 Tax=Paraoerskovia marina TaxID=545619 RepID=A0A1H1LX57_9CELL|nr:GAF domain-containing protein [Paraoerskovia marina]SDR79101.1 GAF domain-containing protein [Paraoerskovia marina]
MTLITGDSTQRSAGEPLDPAGIRAAYEAFLSGGRVPGRLRPGVVASWKRSLRSGVNPESPAAGLVPGSDTRDSVGPHPLSRALPVVRSMLVEAARSDGMVVALMDDGGQLLWVDGHRGVRDAVADVGFVEGAIWREEYVGTNAPGTALATRRPVQVLGAEHFTRPVQAFNCAAAPIHSPDGRVVGILDVTGGEPAGSSVVMSLVRATAEAVERELATDPSGVDAYPSRARLDVLGDGGRLRTRHGTTRLGPRHTEILLLLAERPAGLGADELAVLLHPGSLSEVAVRAEVSRLRRVVGPLLAGSRPYRAAAPLHTDVADVRAALASGDVAAALAAYPGPVLPRSVAPGVVAIRDELAAELRAAVHACSDPDVVLRWLATSEGGDDYAGWQRTVDLTSATSPLGVRARARLALLDRELGSLN